MKKTLLNKEEILAQYPSVNNLGDLFKMIEADFITKGQLICQFKINGLALNESDEKKLSTIDLSEVETFEIESENPKELLFGLLDNWIKELPILIESTDQLSKEIRFNGIEGYLKSFVDLVDSCQFLIESLINLRSIVRKESFNEESWSQNEEMTARAIGQALTSFEKKDFVLLAEVLEYDLGHSLQVWLEEIRNLKENLKNENGGNGKQTSEGIFNKQGSAEG